MFISTENRIERVFYGCSVRCVCLFIWPALVILESSAYLLYKSAEQFSVVRQ